MIEGMTVTTIGEDGDIFAGATGADGTAIMSPMEFTELLLRDNQGIVTYKLKINKRQTEVNAMEIKDTYCRKK